MFVRLFMVVALASFHAAIARHSATMRFKKMIFTRIFVCFDIFNRTKPELEPVDDLK